MKTTVIDASLLVKLFFEEEDSREAVACIAESGELLAPDFLWVQTANVIWKRHRRGDISADTALGLMRSALSLPVAIHPSAGLLPDALDLAMGRDRTIYDCLYLALAVQRSSVLLTGDRRLVNALAGSPLEKHIAWIGRPRRR